MSRIKIWSALVVVGLSACFAIALAQDKSKGPSKGSTKKSTARAAEPSKVYGYISLVDPRTSEKHVILDRSSEPPAINGYPTFHVVFRNLETNALHRVAFLAAAGLHKFGEPPVAYVYSVPLVQDRSETSATPRQVTRAAYPRLIIRYNPDIWAYDSVEMGPYEYRPEGAAFSVRERIPLRRRATPFPEFPDIPDGRDLP